MKMLHRRGIALHDLIIRWRGLPGQIHHTGILPVGETFAKSFSRNNIWKREVVISIGLLDRGVCSRARFSAQVHMGRFMQGLLLLSQEGLIRLMGQDVSTVVSSLI